MLSYCQNFSSWASKSTTFNIQYRLVVFVFFGLLVTSAIALENPSAQIEQAKEFYFSGDYDSSAKLFKSLADSGDAEAQYYLGIIYTKDQFLEKDVNKALSYLLSAADQNHHDAMWQLGQMYNNGDVVEKNLLVATDWYRKSEQLSPPVENIQFYKSNEGGLTEQSTSEVIQNLTQTANGGDVEAQYKLAKIYDTGKLTKGNESEALQWYLKAATNGHEHSMYMVGYFYCRGIGTSADHEKANQWFAKSNTDIQCK
jgi:TPR repeat protein